MLNKKIKFIESIARPFYNNLTFWPFSVKFIRHPIYKQVQYEYNRYFSHYYNFEQLIKVKRGFDMFCRGDKGSVEMDLIMSGDYEPDVSQYILDNVRELDYFLDVGANIGYYSLLIAKIRPDINIISFEPVKETFDRLLKNIEVNKFINITPNNFGLANENKDTCLFLDKELGHNSLLKKDGQKETITVKRLDDILTLEHRKILIKIDTEGYEFETLKGMKNLLNSNDCKIIFEFTPKSYKELYKNDNAPQEFIDFLKKHDYKIILVGSGYLREYQWVYTDQVILFASK